MVAALHAHCIAPLCVPGALILAGLRVSYILRALFNAISVFFLPLAASQPVSLQIPREPVLKPCSMAASHRSRCPHRLSRDLTAHFLHKSHESPCFSSKAAKQSVQQPISLKFPREWLSRAKRGCTWRCACRCAPTVKKKAVK